MKDRCQVMPKAHIDLF